MLVQFPSVCLLLVFVTYRQTENYRGGHTDTNLTLYSRIDGILVGINEHTYLFTDFTSKLMENIQKNMIVHFFIARPLDVIR